MESRALLPSTIPLSEFVIPKGFSPEGSAVLAPPTRSLSDIPRKRLGSP